MLNYRKGWRHISYADLYLDSLRSSRCATGTNSRQDRAGRHSAPGLMDMRLTPLGSTYPGVEMLATAIDNLDRGDWLREVPRPFALPFALVLIGLIAVAFARGISAARTGYALLAVSAAALAAAWLALMNGTFVPVFAPLALGWAFYLASTTLAYLDERAQRLRTADAFKRFLDPRVVTELIGRGEIDYRAQAAAREITVLFTDIRGFTALSERPRRKMSWSCSIATSPARRRSCSGMAARSTSSSAMRSWPSGARRRPIPIMRGERCGRARHVGSARRAARRARPAGCRARDRHRPAYGQRGGRLHRLRREARLHGHRRFGELREPYRRPDQRPFANPRFEGDA